MTTKTAAGGGLLHDWPTSETLYPVLDDLEALEFYGDDDQGHLRRLATLWRSQPSLVQVRARAQFHAAELQRLTSPCNERGPSRPSCPKALGDGAATKGGL